MSDWRQYADPVEIAKMRAFMDAHDAIQHIEGDGHRYYLDVSMSSGIAPALRVRCSCGDESNISNYDKW